MFVASSFKGSGRLEALGVYFHLSLEAEDSSGAIIVASGVNKQQHSNVFGED